MPAVGVPMKITVILYYRSSNFPTLDTSYWPAPGQDLVLDYKTRNFQTLDTRALGSHTTTRVMKALLFCP